MAYLLVILVTAQFCTHTNLVRKVPELANIFGSIIHLKQNSVLMGLLNAATDSLLPQGSRPIADSHLAREDNDGRQPRGCKRRISRPSVSVDHNSSKPSSFVFPSRL